jgi:hypothetical protein
MASVAPMVQTKSCSVSAQPQVTERRASARRSVRSPGGVSSRAPSVETSRASAAAIRLSDATRSVAGSRYAAASGTTPGSRKAAISRPTPSETAGRVAVMALRGGRGVAPSSALLRTKNPDLGRASTSPAPSSTP